MALRSRVASGTSCIDNRNIDWAEQPRTAQNRTAQNSIGMNPQHNVSDDQPLARHLKREWRFSLAGMLFSFLFASVLISGWPQGLIPNMSIPFAYDGDGIFYSMVGQRMAEGSIFDLSRNGYPFGSSMSDYPMPDLGNLAILKALGALQLGHVTSVNLFFLASFPVTFLFAFLVLLSMRVERTIAVVGAVLFTFLPFHFQRLTHTFYLWYFVAPLYFLLAVRLFCDDGKRIIEISERRFNIVFFGSILLLSAFGAYYAFFGLVVVGTAAVLQMARLGTRKSFLVLVAVTLTSLLGVCINLLPYFFNKILNGKNLDIVVRNAAESEIYGLKLIQIVLPRLGHRNSWLAEIAQNYSTTYPLVNENSTAALGALGVVGLVSLGYFFFRRFAQKNDDNVGSFVALIVLALFLVGTVGGFGAIFSATVSPLIRGWNRISVFIGFGALVGLCFAISTIRRRFPDSVRSKKVILFSSIATICLGLYDQTTAACIACNEQIKAAFESDAKFVRSVEAAVPTGSAVYQLPYMSFPETAPTHRLTSYEHFTGYLHSQTLLWSHGAIRGRDGDTFFKALTRQSLSEQIRVVSSLGFAGVSVDRRGYADGGDGVVAELTRVLGPSFVSRADKQVVFFRITSPQSAIRSGSLSLAEVSKLARLDIQPDTLLFTGEEFKKLPRQVGVLDGDAIVDDGRTGFAIFGPYAPLRVGTYKLEVYGTYAGTSGESYVDVVADKGAKQLFRAALTKSNADRLISDNVRINADYSDIEVRIFVSKQDALRLKGYKMQRTEEQ